LVHVLYETVSVYYEKQKKTVFYISMNENMHEPTNHAESVHIVVFWDVTQRNIEGGYRRFAGTSSGLKCIWYML
jgi:hypothetical protein